VTFAALSSSVSQIEIPPPSNCVSSLKFGGSIQEVTLDGKIIISFLGGFELKVVVTSRDGQRLESALPHM